MLEKKLKKSLECLYKNYDKLMNLHADMQNINYVWAGSTTAAQFYKDLFQQNFAI